MTSSVTNELTAMKNATAFNQSQALRTTGMENDSNMFLTLMLQQLQNQDPTQPTENTQWLSQLAQYSSLEQMAQMNSGLEDCASFISAMYHSMNTNSEITQTLSMIGKDVTLKIPDENDKNKFETVTGTVSEATFEDGTVKIKVGDNYYSIENIVSIREPKLSSNTTADAV